MFVSRAELEDLKQFVKSLARTVEDLSTEVKVMRRELDELKTLF